MGHGMMRGGGPGMGYGRGHHGPPSGMMGPGMGMGPGRGARGRAFSKEDATAMITRHLNVRNNPNIKLGEVTEQEEYYEARIVTKDGNAVDTLRIDKNTGWFQSIHDQDTPR